MPVQSFLAIDGPGDELPLAGTLRVPVTATPILTASQQANGVLASSVTRNITINVPAITDGEIITEGHLMQMLETKQNLQSNLKIQVTTTLHTV